MPVDDLSGDDQIRARLETLVEPVHDAGAVVAAIEAGQPRPAYRRRGVRLLAAAAVVVAVATFATVVSFGDESGELVAGPETTETMNDPADPPAPVDGASSTAPVEPTAPLRARLELAATTVEAGASLEGEVVVQNDTGEPIVLEGCGSPYGVGLQGDQAEQGVARPLCLEYFTLPPGESRWPVWIPARHTSCDMSENKGGPGPPCGADGLPPFLPPGSYTAVVEASDHQAPIPPNLDILVTPAP